MEMFDTTYPIFQSTLPQGERRTCRNCRTESSNFNPRSHKGSDITIHHKEIWIKISIHAPTRGATLYNSSIRNRTKISIHAPTRGATVIDMILKNAVKNFNPRSHKGSDPLPWEIRLYCFYFNPRSHKGSDTNPTEERADRNDFNPRSHKGSDARALIGNWQR